MGVICKIAALFLNDYLHYFSSFSFVIMLVLSQHVTLIALFAYLEFLVYYFAELL